MSHGTPVPRPVLERIVLYLRQLERFGREGLETVSSAEIGEAVGATAAQVRKDLSRFGQLGQRGLGYDVRGLDRTLRSLLSLDREWRAALVGAGNIGRALCTYRPFRERGFHIVALFDNDPHKEGCTWARLKVLPMNQLRRTVRELRIELGVITVPPEAAQHVADQLVAAGVAGLLNFAPTRVVVPESIPVRSADLAVDIELLAFLVADRGRARRP
ncbi:MAG TPA: redox-sensing transcriptional repressor Rex [Planctomycetota bacterium]|nr:redox-sensing transcriptional repressor Rex [Planctomycetota bacterium]